MMTLSQLSAFVLAIVLYVGFCFYVRKHGVPETRVLAQLVAVFSWPSFLFVTALCSPVDKGTPMWAFIWFLYSVVPLVGLLVLVVRKRSAKGLSEPKWHKWDMRVMGLVVALLAVALSRSWMLDSMITSDSSEYMAAIDAAATAFTFGPRSIVPWRLCGHAAYGMAFITLPGIFLTPDTVVGLHLMGVLWCSISAAATYMILCRLSSPEDVRLEEVLQNTLLTIMLYCAPLLMSMQSGYNADYYATLLVPVLAACVLYELPVLSFVIFFVLGFTKEPMWLFLGVFAMAVAACELHRARKEDHGAWGPTLRHVLLCKRVAPLCLGLAVGGLGLLASVMLARLWVAGSYYDGTDVSTAGNPYNIFSLNGDNVRARLLQVIVLNFNWVLLGLGLAAWIVLQRVDGMRSHPKHGGCNSPSADMGQQDAELVETAIPLLSGGIVYAVFLCSYITAALPRYTGPVLISLGLVSILLVRRALSYRLAIPLETVLLALFVVQCMGSVDPLSNLVFKTIDVGEGVVLNVGQKSFEDPTCIDYYAYNLETVWETQALRQMMSDCKYTTNDYVVIAGNTRQECTRNGSLVEFDGRLKQVSRNGAPRRLRGWDNSTQTYRNVLNDATDSVRVVRTNDLFGYESWLENRTDSEEVYEHAREFLNSHGNGRYIVYFDPLMEMDEKQCIGTLAQYFNVGPRHTVDVMGWTLSYYVMVKKQMVPTDVTTDGVVRSGASISGTVETFDASDLTLDGGGEVATIDLESIQNARADVGPDAVATCMLQSLSSYSETEQMDERRPIRAGDVILCRVKIFVDGTEVPNSVEPTQLYLMKILAGSSCYVGDIGKKVVGQPIGTTLWVTATTSRGFGDIVQGLGDKTVELEIKVLKYYSQLEYSFDEVIEDELDVSTEEYLASLEDSLRVQGITSEDVLYACVSLSTYAPSEQSVASYMGALDECFSQQWETLGLSKEDFVSEYLGVNMEEYNRMVADYARYKAKEYAVAVAYGNQNVDVYSYGA